MQIIDAQHHEIGPWWDWSGEKEETQHRILVELAVAYLDALGIDGALLIPSGGDKAVSWAVDHLPERFAYAPVLTPETPDLERVVAEGRKRKGLVAFRSVVGWPLDGSEARRLEAGDWDAVFAACQKHQMPVFLFFTRFLPQVAYVAERFPDLPLIIDHMGIRQPPIDEPETPKLKSLPDLLAHARFPNVNVKLCGLPALSGEAFPYTDMNPALRSIVDAYGAERVMWASDATRFVGTSGIGRWACDLSRTGNYVGRHHYADAFHYIRDNPVLSTAEKEQILGGTVRRLLGWAPSKPTMPRT